MEAAMTLDNFAPGFTSLDHSINYWKVALKNAKDDIEKYKNNPKKLKYYEEHKRQIEARLKNLEKIKNE